MIDAVRPGEKQFLYRYDWIKPFDDVRSQLSVDVIQMECGNVLEIENRSTWPMFLCFYRNGEFMTNETLRAACGTESAEHIN